jgi:FAD-linked oxidoreductase
VPDLWTNWAGEQRCAPVRIERPHTEGGLVDVVKRAVADGLTLKVVGSGHSFTDAACTDGVLVDISALRQVLAADKATGLVTVEAGITLHRLGKELAARGLAMENQGDIDAQTLAGAISTATHGTGATFANISSQVRGMRLVTAAGEVLDIADGDELLAARVGVGALGAIASVTLQAVPLFTIERRDEPRPLEETLDRFEEIAAAADHFEFFTFPYTDVALTRTSTRSDREPQPGNRRVEILQELLFENGALAAIGAVARRVPGAIPSLNRAAVKALSPSVKIDRSHNVYASRRSVKFTEMEYAIPRASGPEALRRVLELIERRRLPVAFPIEFRVVAADDAFLSTACGRKTVYIAVHQHRGMEFETYMRGVEAIMDEYGGRPHWGKRHYQSAATLAPRYPDWEKFAAVRDRLDPDRAFANDYTRRALA